MPETKKNKNGSVRKILLMGVFWRILFIEAVLLVYSLGYKWITEDATAIDLFWYSVRITILVAIIVIFMMVTLKQFLGKKIIAPLEAIAESNKKAQKDFLLAGQVNLPHDSPDEIEAIVTSRARMLKTILDVSEERLKYSNALNDELERGKKIQKDFLPNKFPDAINCDIAAYFHSALQMSGDFYDVFELPDNHLGFVIGDVSGKGVGAALFMTLTRSLLRIFSGSFSSGTDSCRLDGADNIWLPEDALRTVYLTNEYIAKEHGEDGMFVTLFFGAIDPLNGKVYYVNAGHEPFFIIDKNGIKNELSGTGPALGPIEGASYKIETVQLKSGDMIFGYTDGITEARSLNREFYTRTRLEKLVNMKFSGSSKLFLEKIKNDLFKFTADASQSDDITMIAIKWEK